MKVLLEPLIFNIQHYGGISRYYAELLRVLSANSEVVIDLPLYTTENLHLKSYDFGESFLIKTFGKLFPWRIKNYLSQKSARDTLKLLKSAKYDLFIPTYYDPSFLEVIGKTPFVLTVHDMIHEIYPQLEAGSSIVQDKKILIESATKIIAVSDHTKKDILRFYPHIPEKKIHVVHLCHSISKSNVSFDHLRNIVGGTEYILFVGNRGVYKNFKWFLKTVSSWLKENRVSLLCLGGGSFNSEECQDIANLELKEYVKQYTFKDHELYFFYNNSIAFVFPSEYEGFGIPILEAMYSGCPVILPNRTSFPEVAGDAGEYIDLDEGQSLIESLDKVHKDPEYREELIDRGFKRALKFSWENTVSACLKVYREAVS